MKHLSSTEIRNMFLQFFKEKVHDVEPSAPLVPIDDPSLLWINSGVATLKKYFDGTIVPKNPKITNAQKAIRTNDIENVGYTARHHTFFEMLGNFSIGDYFKKEAIEYAWEFLTSEKWLNFDKERLSVTVHPEDDEAYDIWLKDIQIPEERIIRLEENFWDIGEGPSGPNTEIFYDRGPEYGDDPKDPELYPGGENERYLEVWNLVFSQFNHNPDGTYTPLPNKNIDTGLGLERLVSIIQDTPTNFETDLFMPIIKHIEKYTNVRYGDNAETDTAFKVIADHIRTVAFAIGDKALPSNEGRGYVLRRLISRVIWFAKVLEIDEPFMYELVDTVGNIMKDYYPEVTENKEHIATVIKNEEERFHETLNDGLAMLKQIIEKEKKKKSTVFPGEQVFKLYDTYGFPKELTEEYVAEYGFTIDQEGVEKEMEKQRTRARKARAEVHSMGVQTTLLNEYEEQSEFVGYHSFETETKIVRIIKDNQFVDFASTEDEVIIILEATPFYAESGGQIADTGTLSTADAEVMISDVNSAPHGQHLHYGTITRGNIKVGETVQAKINEENRTDIIKNHTATHLLHRALKDVLGAHVNQAGSLVAEERLRFDFSHFHAVTNEELEQIEQKVNEKIWESISLKIEHMEKEQAEAIGAMALFGEKYDDIVRVVMIDDYSIELCGGCHVENTSEIGIFKILSETGIGAGTRRIEAVTGKYAYEFMNEKVQMLEDISKDLNSSVDQVKNRITDLQQQIKQLEKENESLSDQLSNIEAKSLVNRTEEINGIQVLAERVNVSNMNQLRSMLDEMREVVPSGIILLAAENNNKVQLVAGVSDDLVEEGYHAGKLIKQAAEICGGGGGGRPNMAQAGGNNPEKITEALNFVKNYLKE